MYHNFVCIYIFTVQKYNGTRRCNNILNERLRFIDKMNAQLN